MGNLENFGSKPTENNDKQAKKIWCKVGPYTMKARPGVSYGVEEGGCNLFAPDEEYNPDNVIFCGFIAEPITDPKILAELEKRE